jgi:hypothetical protein
VRIESINQSTTRFEIVRASVTRSRPSLASRPRSPTSNPRDVARASVASVGRLASPRAPSSVVRRDLAVVANAINRDAAASRARASRPGGVLYHI